MTQQQGNSSTAGGRIDGSIGSVIAAAQIALGVGWGTTASVAVATGSNDQRGRITVTSSGTGQAQATATVVLTFKDGAYAAQPFALVRLAANTQAVAEAQPTLQSVTTLALTFSHAVLPVDTKTYTYEYLVVQ